MFVTQLSHTSFDVDICFTSLFPHGAVASPCYCHHNYEKKARCQKYVSTAHLGKLQQRRYCAMFLIVFFLFYTSRSVMCHLRFMVLLTRLLLFGCFSSVPSAFSLLLRYPINLITSYDRYIACHRQSLASMGKLVATNRSARKSFLITNQSKTIVNSNTCNFNSQLLTTSVA